MSNDSSFQDGSQALPPLSNTGVTNFGSGGDSGIWTGLDYLTITFHGELARAAVMAVPDGFDLQVKRQCEKSVKGNYTRQWELYPAGLLFHNPDELRQGWHIEFKGSDLRVLRDSGISDNALLSWVLTHPGLKNIPRMDVALDFLNMSAPVSALRSSYEAGKMKTRLLDNWYDSAGPDGKRAWSLYLGSKDSDKRLVIYDKRGERLAKEQAVSIREWTRLEIRVKGKIAMAAAHGVLKYGSLEVVKDMAMRTVDFEGSWWAEKLAAVDETRKVAPVERKETDTGAWVERTALPGIIGYLSEHYDEYVFLSLLQSVIGLSNDKYKHVFEKDRAIVKAIRDAGWDK